MRTLISTGLILFLLAVIYANAVGNAQRDAHSKAAIRLIDEALMDNDIESIRRAIDEYNKRGKSPSVIVEVLADRRVP